MNFKQRLIRGLKPLARDFRWFGFCRGSVSMADLDSEVIAPAQTYTISPPAWLDERIAPDQWRKRVNYVPLYRGELRDGITTHQCGYVTHDNRLVEEPSVWFTHPVEDHRLFNSIRPFQKIEHHEGTLLSLLAPAGLNHYHWLFDTLPKLGLLGVDGYPPGTKIYTQYDKPLFRETLAHLGIGPDRVINSRDHQVIRADRLVVANHPNPCAAPHPKVVSWWREQLDLILADIPVADDVVFISRRDAKIRLLHNEEELIRHAGGQEWRRLQLRGMDFLEQLAVFRSARVIITTHGAALANLIAIRPGTVVLEIVPEILINYHLLAEQMGARYHALRCDGETKTPTGQGELVVDPARFRSAVERALAAAG